MTYALSLRKLKYGELGISTAEFLLVIPIITLIGYLGFEVNLQIHERNNLHILTRGHLSYPFSMSEGSDENISSIYGASLNTILKQSDSDSNMNARYVAKHNKLGTFSSNIVGFNLLEFQDDQLYDLLSQGTARVTKSLATSVNFAESLASTLGIIADRPPRNTELMLIPTGHYSTITRVGSYLSSLYHEKNSPSDLLFTATLHNRLGGYFESGYLDNHYRGPAYTAMVLGLTYPGWGNGSRATNLQSRCMARFNTTNACINETKLNRENDSFTNYIIDIATASGTISTILAHIPGVNAVAIGAETGADLIRQEISSRLNNVATEQINRAFDSAVSQASNALKGTIERGVLPNYHQLVLEEITNLDDRNN